MSLLLLAWVLLALAQSAPLQAPPPEAGDVHAAQALHGAAEVAIPPSLHNEAHAAIPPPFHSKVEPAPKISLLHMQDGVWFFKRLGEITLANKRRYAARWRYDMVVSGPMGVEGVQRPVECTQGRTPPCFAPDHSFDIDHSRAPTFGKIKLARAACASRPDHWLLWSDADALVVNQSVPLESIIDDGYDLIFAYDWLMMNAGMLLLKCSPWTDAFLASVYDARKFDKARALDQSSIQEHLDALSQAERESHLKIIPKHAINVYLEEYRPGDFLVHMAGKLYEATEQGLIAITNQLDILSQMDDIRDVSAFFDTVHLLNYYSGTCNVTLGLSNASCKPDDKRRIRLKEPLIAMSSPNRYRHVHMRYYWMKNWQDKYDVPFWNAKKKALPMPVDSHKSELTILTEELEAIDRARKAGAKQPDAAAVDPVADEKPADKEAQAAHDEMKPHVNIKLKDTKEEEDDNVAVKLEAMKQQAQAGQEVRNQQDLSELDHDEPPENSGGSMGRSFLIFLLPFAVVAIIFVYRKRRRAALKVH